MKLPLFAAACVALTVSTVDAQRRENRLDPDAMCRHRDEDSVVSRYGHCRRYDELSAKKPLLIWAGIGVGLAVVGGVPIGVTGANPYSLVGAPLVVGGMGMVTQAGLTGLVRLFDERLEGRTSRRVPYSLELGTSWVHDAYRDRMLMRAQGRVAADRLEILAGGYRSYDNAYRAGDLGARVRILGETDVANGDFVEVRATGRLRDDDDDRVKVATMEGEVATRLRAMHLAPQLRGMFGELALGGGIERAAFRNGHELGGLMLARFAWGVYLPDWGAGQRGELQLYYDHRRDSLAGGIAAYRAAGFVGSVGAIVDYRVWGPWAVHAELEIGSAWVSTLGIRYEGGTR